MPNGVEERDAYVMALDDEDAIFEFNSLFK